MNFMKRAGFVLTCATMLANLCAAQNTERTPQGMKCTTQGMDIRVEFYSPSIVRVYKTPEGKPYNKESLVVVKSPETVKVDFSEEAGQTVLKSSILKVLVNPATGGISFHTIAGNELLKDKDYGTSFADKNDAGTPSYQVRGSFLLDKDEPIYGVGQVMDGKFNRRNSMHHMQNENMFTYSPYFMSPVKGYAVYWDNYSISEFMDTPQELAFQSLGHCADYYFMYGGNADGIIAQVRDLTGHSPMLPLWAYGFFQSKERYHTQEESLNVLKKYRELQIPEREHVHLFSLFHVARERLCRILGQLLHFRIHGYSAGTRFPEPGTLCGLLFHVWRKRRRHHRPGARLDGTLPHASTVGIRFLPKQGALSYAGRKPECLEEVSRTTNSH